MIENKVKIYFGGDLTNLYEIGWLSSDLSQLIDFAELVEEGKEERPEIVDVRKGSVELVIAGCSVAAAVIMPLVQIAVQRYFTQRDEEVSFQI